MKSLQFFLENSNITDYLFCYAVICDKEMSDYILETIDVDMIGQQKVKQIKNLVMTNKVDKVMICWKNNDQTSYKELAAGTIININDKIFISLGSGDGLDSEEFESKIVSKHNEFSKGMKENGYVLSKDNFGPNMEPAKESDIKMMKKSLYE